MHFACYLFILQARIAKTRKCVGASAVARKEREDPSIWFLQDVAKIGPLLSMGVFFKCVKLACMCVCVHKMTN